MRSDSKAYWLLWRGGSSIIAGLAIVVYIVWKGSNSPNFDQRREFHMGCCLCIHFRLPTIDICLFGKPGKCGGGHWWRQIQTRRGSTGMTGWQAALSTATFA